MSEEIKWKEVTKQEFEVSHPKTWMKQVFKNKTARYFVEVEPEKPKAMGLLDRVRGFNGFLPGSYLTFAALVEQYIDERFAELKK